MAFQLTQQLWKHPAGPASVTVAGPEKAIPTDEASQNEQVDPAETQVPKKDNPDLAERDAPPNPSQPKSSPKKCAQR
jgi:hypothetical protein